MTLTNKVRAVIQRNTLFVVAVSAIGLMSQDATQAERLRKPAAMVVQADRLVVGNEATGTISIVDLVTKTVTAEHKIAPQINDMVAVGKSRILVADSVGGKLMLLALAPDQRIAVVRSWKLSSPPERLAYSDSAKIAAVTSRWARQVTFVSLDDDARVKLETVELSYAPGLATFMNADRLIVADAFGGRIGVIRVSSPRIESVREIPGHNIRGLAWSPGRKKLLVSHQKLNPLARTDFDDLHWGMLVTNGVRGLAAEVLTNEQAKLLDGADLQRLGMVGRGSGDAGVIWSDERSRQVVALAGVDEVEVSGASYAQRFPTGRLPSAIAVHDNRLYIANKLDDSISVIDLEAGKSSGTIPLGTVRKRTAVERGERLFFSARVSHDGWLSCHSCHTDGHSSGQLVDTLGDGDFGAPKRVPSLLGTADFGPWSWLGKLKTLDEQVTKSIQSTMHGKDLNDEQLSDLLTYVKSLVPPSVKAKEKNTVVVAGRKLFADLQCVRCHQPPRYTSNAIYDVGLKDQNGRSRFNPPSLLGVGLRQRYFHDGRAKSLEEVVRVYRHQLKEPLTEEKRRQLLAFLRSL